MNKKELDKMKPSAYKSMWLAKENKGKGENKGKLRKWINEEWVNLNALYIKNPSQNLPCGQKYKGQKDPTVCRPKYDKSDNTHKTPKPLAGDLTRKKVQEAIKIKKKGERVQWKKLK
jgi:hypothetical protein